MTTDSTAVMPAAARQLAAEWYPCACHVLHSSATKSNDALFVTEQSRHVLRFVEELPTTLK